MDQKSTMEDFRGPQGRISVRQKMCISIPHAEYSLPLYICRLQNVASSTYLDLDNGDNVNGMKMNYRWWEHFCDLFGFCTSTGTKVQGFQYVDTSNQRWDLRRVSRTGSEIRAMTIHSQTMAFIPNNIYILYNLTSGTVLDLDNGAYHIAIYLCSCLSRSNSSHFLLVIY